MQIWKFGENESPKRRVINCVSYVEYSLAHRTEYPPINHAKLAFRVKGWSKEGGGLLVLYAVRVLKQFQSEYSLSIRINVVEVVLP